MSLHYIFLVRFSSILGRFDFGSFPISTTTKTRYLLVEEKTADLCFHNVSEQLIAGLNVNIFAILQTCQTDKKRIQITGFRFVRVCHVHQFGLFRILHISAY